VEQSVGAGGHGDGTGTKRIRSWGASLRFESYPRVQNVERLSHSITVLLFTVLGGLYLYASHACKVPLHSY